MKYIIRKRSYPTENELLEDIKRVMFELKTNTLTMRDYDENGHYSSSSVLRKLGKWNDVLKSINASVTVVSHEDLDLLGIWIIKSGLLYPLGLIFVILALGIMHLINLLST